MLIRVRAPAIEGGTVLVRAPEVIAVHVGEVMVLHDPCSDSYVRLNASGKLLWERLSEPCSLRELGAALAERYGLEAVRAMDDAGRLTAELLARGMVSVAR